jgi:hypothetical protein
LMLVFGPEAQLKARKTNTINDSHANFITNDKSENSLLDDLNVQKKERSKEHPPTSRLAGLRRTSRAWGIGLG